jgi:CBS domain-containing protein
VSSIAPPPSIIEISSVTTLHDGFQALINGGVLSAPVYMEGTHEYIGFLDIRDLVALVVFAYDDQKVSDNSLLANLIHYGVIGFNTENNTEEGVSVSFLARRHPFKPVRPSDSLYKVLKVLTKGTHRVPVVDDTGKVINIISQSTFVKLLYTLKVEDIFPISQIPAVGTTNVVTVNMNESLIKTLRVIVKNKISGVGIVNNQGQLIGTTTGKDLKLFLHNPTLQALNRPIFDNMKAIRAEDVNERNTSISTFETDTLKRVISLLCVTKVHRIFVMNNESEFKPVRVISIVDILKYLIK